MRKMNFGCGDDYRPGWINVDVTEETKWRQGARKPDVLVSVNDSSLPFEDSSIDYILMDNVLEHLQMEKVHGLLTELHRVLHPGGTLDIYAPHFKGIGVKFLEHVRGYGINSLWYYEQYFDITQTVLLISRSGCSSLRRLKLLNCFNFLFNFSPLWQQVCEKFMPGGFEEIHYVMVKKPPQPQHQDPLAAPPSAAHVSSSP